MNIAPVQQPHAVQPAQNSPANLPLVQAVPLFTLRPALHNNGNIDYATVAVQKLYKQGIEKVQEELFDVEANGVHAFLNALADKAEVVGWSSILNIPKDIAHPNNDLVDLTTNYGEISLVQVRAHASSYVATQTRQAQDSMMLYTCLMASLSKTGKNKITVYKHDYTVPVTGGTMTSGAALLKIIIRECHIDTRATVRQIRSKLMSLPSYLASINQDIPAFNRYVLDLLEQLHARGETTHDLLANLFESYKSVTDKDFVALIKHKENQYDDGEDIDVHRLMHIAQQKYKTMVGDKTWDVPTKEQEQIVALEAKLAALNKKPGKDKNNKKTKDSGKDGAGKKKKKKKKNGQTEGESKKFKIAPWMTKAPKAANMKKPKKVDNVEYHWCPKHARWTQQKASECKLPDPNNTSPTSTSTSTSSSLRNNNNSSNPSLRLNGAMTRVVTFADEDSDE